LLEFEIGDHVFLNVRSNSLWYCFTSLFVKVAQFVSCVTVEEVRARSYTCFRGWSCACKGEIVCWGI